ncbi:MAG: phosphatase PAP2 family protein [Deltaproteobacteria bacterium]|nr:phosphatase PAP2 family protein [Deltaproteobacteria bacterium]
MANVTNRCGWRRLLVVLMSVAIIAGCACYDGRIQPVAVPEFRADFLSGYLSTETTPSSLALLPPPPATGSAAFALDEEISRRSFALRDTPRWLLAISDADLAFPHAAGTFSCALNVPITEEDTPHLYMLLRRSMTDLGRSTATAKNQYNRTRPFVLNKEPMCTPEDKAQLEKNGSYPSGHTAIGWGWTLILSEISPEQTDAILARGLSFGESRNVCNVHWHSDVVQGRIMAAGTVARLHADPAFRADVEAARAELAAVRNKGLKPARDCSAEAAALAVQPSLAQ